MEKFDAGVCRNDEDCSTDASTGDSVLSRRRFLGATTAAVAVAGLAGCNEATQQSFEATPVVLPDAAQEEFVLAETARDSETITRDGPGGTEVSITNHASVYQRGPALVASRPETGTDIPSKFISRVNGTEGPGTAISVRGPTYVAGEAIWSFLEERPTVSGDQFGLILPAGARGDDGIAPGQTMTVISGEAFQREEVTYGGDGPGASLPSQYFDLEGQGIPQGWFHPEVPVHSSSRYFVPEIETLLDRAGIDELPEDAELIEEGRTFEPDEDIVFIGPTDVMVAPAGRANMVAPPGRANIYDEGVSLYGGASSFGLGALATPDASVGEESANPIVDRETGELLQGEIGRRMLARAGVSDADTVEWLAGPESVDFVSPPRRVNMGLGWGAELEPFVGVVSSDNGPFGILTQIVRGTDDDHVIAASVVRRPVATPEGGMAGLRANIDVDPVPFIATEEHLVTHPEVMSQLERL